MRVVSSLGLLVLPEEILSIEPITTHNIDAIYVIQDSKFLPKSKIQSIPHNYRENIAYKDILAREHLRDYMMHNCTASTDLPIEPTNTHYSYSSCYKSF